VSKAVNEMHSQLNFEGSSLNMCECFLFTFLVEDNISQTVLYYTNVLGAVARSVVRNLTVCCTHDNF
jgi:hypothetical protein